MNTPVTMDEYIEYYCSQYYYELKKNIVGSNSVFFISKVVGTVYEKMHESSYENNKEVKHMFDQLVSGIDYHDLMAFQDELNRVYPTKKIRLYMAKNFVGAKV